MEPGDAIVFNHLLVHGSPSNCSSKPRRSIGILQSRKLVKKKNSYIYKKETSFRTNFVVKAFKRISKLS